MIYYFWRIPRNFLYHLISFCWCSQDDKDEKNKIKNEEKIGFWNSVLLFFKPDFRKFQTTVEKGAQKDLIKFEKIMAHEVTGMIEFYRFSLNEKDDNEFNRRDEIAKLMETVTELSKTSREGAIRSREMNAELNRKMNDIQKMIAKK